jgi:hypothetical protein
MRLFSQTAPHCWGSAKEKQTTTSSFFGLIDSNYKHEKSVTIMTWFLLPMAELNYQNALFVVKSLIMRNRKALHNSYQ